MAASADVLFYIIFSTRRIETLHLYIAFFVLKPKTILIRFHSFSFVVLLVVICCTNCCHSLSFTVTRCHSLSLVVTHHSLSLVVTRCTTRLSFYKRSKAAEERDIFFIIFQTKYKWDLITVQEVSFFRWDNKVKEEIIFLCRSLVTSDIFFLQKGEAFLKIKQKA